MRGFRIIHHTEKVGVAVGRIRPDPEGETHLDPQQGRVTKRVRLRRCWPGLGIPLALPSKCLKSRLLGCHLTTVWTPVRSLGRSSVRHTMCAAAVPVMGSGRRVGAEKDGTWPVIAKQYDAHSLTDEPNPPPQPGLGFGPHYLTWPFPPSPEHLPQPTDQKETYF